MTRNAVKVRGLVDLQAARDDLLALRDAMMAHPNWSKPGYTITHEQIEADRHAHALEEAIDYFKAHDPDRLAALLEE